MRHIVAVRRSALVAMGLVLGGVGFVSAQQVMMMPGGGRGIEVSGIGEVEAKPDEAHLNFAVETSAPTSREAAQQNADRMERVIAALVAAGIPREEIETRNYSVYPEYVTDDRGETPRVRGYRVTNQVALETMRLDAVGTLIDAALAAGANRVEGISFGLSDPRAAEAEALREAVQRARASAETIALALGVPLGQVLRASTSSEPFQPLMMMQGRAMDMAEAGQAFSTPIQPGEQRVRARVVLLFGIGG